MGSKTLLFLLSITAMGAYTVGRHSSPTNEAPAAAIAQPQPPLSKPVALAAPVSPPIAPSASPSTNSPARTTKVQPDKVATAPALERPAPSETKRKVEMVLTAAAIAAIIIKASRDQYHATGRPCACPDDTMRNGRACGSRSAYSRPGGAAPLCYVHDITPAMIENYRQRQASR